MPKALQERAEKRKQFQQQRQKDKKEKKNWRAKDKQQQEAIAALTEEFQTLKSSIAALTNATKAAGKQRGGVAFTFGDEASTSTAHQHTTQLQPPPERDASSRDRYEAFFSDPNINMHATVPAIRSSI